MKHPFKISAFSKTVGRCCAGALTWMLCILPLTTSFAQTKAVLKSIGTNAITENIVIPTGKTITIDVGGTITNNGTSTGFGSGGAWGTITGTLSNQTDLSAALALKAPLISPSFTTPALGTPTSGTLTNCTALPAAGVVGTAAILGTNTFTGIQTISNATASTTNLNGAVVIAGGLGVAGEFHGGNDFVLDSTWGIDAATGNQTMYTAGSLGWPASGGGLATTQDVSLFRDGVGILAQRVGTAAQSFRVYGTTAGSVYLSLGHNGTNAVIDTTSGVINLADTVTLGGGSSASEFRFMEPSGSGYMAFKAQAMAGNVTYTLPAADGTSGQLLSTNGTGTLSWATGGGGSSTIATGNTLWVDAVNGNDTTGTADRQDLPYLTLLEAKADATSGDTIIARPGTYTVTANNTIIKSGVNWHFENGAVVTQAPADTDTIGMLNDTVGVTSKITGSGQFILDCSAREGGNEVCLVTPSSPSTGAYLSLYSAAGAQYDYWFNVDGGGGAPSNPGATNIEILASSGWTDADFASSLASAVPGSGSQWTAVDNTGFVSLTATTAGDRTDATFTGGSVSITQPPYIPIALVKTIASSNLYIAFNELKVICDKTPGGNEYTSPTVAMPTEGSLVLVGDKMTGSGRSTNGIFWTNGSCRVTVGTLTSGIYTIWAAVDDTPTGELYVDADEISGNGNNGISVPIYIGGISASASWVSAKVIRASTAAAAAGGNSFAIVCTGNGKFYLPDCQKIFGRLKPGGGESYIRVQKLAPIKDTVPLIDNSGGGAVVCMLHIDLIDNNSFTEFGLGTFKPSTGSLYLGSYVAPSSGTGLELAGGARLFGSVVDMSASTNKTAVTASAGTTRVESCRIIGTGTGVDVNETGGTCTIVNSTGSGTAGMVRHTNATLIPSIVQHTPTSSGTGSIGSVAVDGTYLYICTGTNTWKRVALTGGY